jgi:hypothetical protein
MDRNMKRIPDEGRDPVNTVEATATMDDIADLDIADLDPPGVGYRAIKEEMPPDYGEPDYRPGPREEMPPEPMPDRVDRILTAVDPKIVHQDLHWKKLLRDIESSVEVYQDAIEVRREKGRSDELAWLKQLKGAAQQLEGLLKPENIIRFRAYKSELVSKSTLDPKYHDLYLGSTFDDYPPKYDPCCSDEALQDLIARCRDEIEDLQQVLNLGEAGPERKALLRLHSPMEWLVGVLLPRIFRSHFLYDPPSTPNGAYARFTEAVLREFHIKKSNGKDYYKRSYIVRTMTASKEAAFPQRAKGPPSRRK